MIFPCIEKAEHAESTFSCVLCEEGVWEAVEEQVFKQVIRILYPKGLLCLPWMQKEELCGWSRNLTLENVLCSNPIVCSIFPSHLFADL